MEKCPLTGESINLMTSPNPRSHYYQTPKTGKVVFTDLAYQAASHLSPTEKEILAGICRNRAINNQEPEMITESFLAQLKDQIIPSSFKERAGHYLQYLYNIGGEEYEDFEFDSDSESPVTYSSRDQFEKIIKYLISEGLLEATMVETIPTTFYSKAHLTKAGIQEVEKGLPKMPMFGLVNQQIQTGDIDIDNNIEHARKLFFDKNSTLENKRSACETLTYVLEPFRTDLKVKFRGDTETFFNLVNNFDIRHNKECTKDIEHEEQLEWVFYSLLNTINTYNKMKKKLS